MDAVLEADTRAVIGEGPLWDEENGRLYWVDILGSELHIFDPKEKINRSVKFTSFVTALAKYSKDELIMTMKDGFYLYHLHDDSLEKSNSRRICMRAFGLTTPNVIRTEGFGQERRAWKANKNKPRFTVWTQMAALSK